MIDDHSAYEQPEKASQAPDSEPNRSGIVERTKLSLPSLTDLDSSDQPTLSSPPGESTLIRTVPPVHNARQNGITLPDIPIPVPITVQHQMGAQSVQSAPTKKRSLPSFLLILLLCILSAGIGAFIYAQISIPTNGNAPLHALVNPDMQRRGDRLPIDAPGGNTSFPVGARAALVIHGHSGNVTVAAGDAGMITIKTSRTSQDHDSAMDGHGISYSKSSNAQGHDVIIMTIAPGSGPINATIDVPASASVQVDVDAGSISVTGIAGVTIDTNSGSLDIEDVSGPVHAYTTNGDVVARNLKGPSTLQSANGSIRATAIAGQMIAATQNGDVILREARLDSQSTLKTTYGSVSFSGSIDSQGSCTLSTHSGNVNLTLPDNALFQLHASTGSGSIYNEFGTNSPDRTRGIHQARIAINVGSGSIAVHKGI